MPSATLAPTPSTPSRNADPAAPPPRATDDEILGITSPRKTPPHNTQQLEFDFDAAPNSTTTLSSRARADVWPDEGPAVDSALGDANANNNPTAANASADAATQSADARATSIPEPAHLRATFDANPELRAAWRDASAYRESFATPDAARQATALLADVNHMDALFFSHRPEDHAALARAIANLDPAAFTSLANAMQTIAANADASRTAGTFSDELSARPASLPSSHTNQLQIPRSARNDNVLGDANTNDNALRGDANANTAAVAATNANADGSRTAGTSSDALAARPAPLTSAAQAQAAANNAQSTANESQLAFLHAANAAAVEGVVAAIEAQVERLLPEGVAKNARTRVVGEIYRELDSSLRSNPQFAAQLRDAFRSGSLDDGHQRAIVSLLTGRARQALPGVAKRVLSEWTSTIMSAANERRTRQRTAERRIDIAGSSGAGNDGRKSMSPRDLDYARLSDADILNL